MTNLKKRFQYIGLFSLLLALTIQTSYAEFPVMPDDEYQSMLTEFKSNPTLFADKEGLIGKLSPDQLSNAIAEIGLTHYTFLHPVQIKAEDIPALINQPLKDYSVMSVRNGKLIAVPFQIDEMDTQGFVYLEGESKLEGTLGIIDPNDELLFMYRDTSQERLGSETEKPAQGEIVKELEFNMNGIQRFAYLVKNSDLRSNSDYVSYDLATSTAKNTFYGFKTQPGNILMFEHFWANVGDRIGERVLDSVFATIETKVLSSWSPTIRLNTFHDIQAVPIGRIAGAVREAVIVRLNVVVANVTVFKINAQFDIFDQMLGVKIKLKIPGADILSRFLVEPHIIIALDFNEQQGARVNAAISPDPNGFAMVDGKLSDFEKDMDIDRENTWIWLSSKHAWDVFARINIPETFPVGVKLYYQDDPEDTVKFENFPGAFPRLGFDVYELPKNFDQIDIDVQFFFPDTIGDIGPKDFKDYEAGNPPVLTVNNININTNTIIASDN